MLSGSVSLPSGLSNPKPGVPHACTEPGRHQAAPRNLCQNSGPCPSCALPTYNSPGCRSGSSWYIQCTYVPSVGGFTRRIDHRKSGSAHCTPGNRVARGGTQGGLNCLTHVLPRCLPTPTEEADGGEGPDGVLSVCRRGRSGWPLGRRLERPRTTAVDRRSTPSARADRQEPLPMFRRPGLPGFL